MKCKTFMTQRNVFNVETLFVPQLASLVYMLCGFIVGSVFLELSHLTSFQKNAQNFDALVLM